MLISFPLSSPMAWPITTIAAGLIIAWLVHKTWTISYNYFLHPLAKFPGPKSVCTGWYKTWQEVFRARNWTDVLFELHGMYGDVVRVGVNELHFFNPATYHEIYNNSVRWDKEESLYHSFGEDRSSFGFLTYREAKARRDVITPFFSKRAIGELQGLVTGNIERLCDALIKENEEGKSSDMLFGLRCFTLNTILEYCFAKDVEALEAPDFQHPIVIAMDAALLSFIVFRNFEIVRKIVFSLPGWLTKLTTPELGGLVDLQRLLGAQVQEVVNNPSVLQRTSQPIIYHRLLDPELNKESGVPSSGSLYEEAQALMFAGGDTAANAIYMAVYHIIQSRTITVKLREEVGTIWPDPAHPPAPHEFEKLPYLTAVVKEALRTTPGVPSPLPRIVPAQGAMLSGQQIPPGTIVGQSMHFVHRSPEVFTNPKKFDPERWLKGEESAKLEKWIVAFSKGPRSCLGQNLGLCEMYVAFGWLFRRFEFELDGVWEEGDMAWRDAFSPAFGKRHVRAFCRPVRE